MPTNRLTLDVGVHDAERRKTALQALAIELQVYGRNLVPSISELVSRLADAYEAEPEATVKLMQDIMYIAQGSYVAEIDEAA